MLKKIFSSRLLLSAMAGGLAFTLLSTDANRYLDISKNMSIFADIYKTVNHDYVEQVDANQLMRIAIDSMLGELDPYTNFFSEAQKEQVRIDVVGGWDGIGVEIQERDDVITIKEIIDETPAMQQELRIGDIIKRIDGKDIKGKKAEEVNKLLNGKAGTKVELTLLRPSTKEERSITLDRTKISRKNVPYYGMLSDNETGYIILTTFTDRAGANIANAIKSLQETHKPKQFILDLRDNGGGLLIEAVNICNLFVPKGKEIVSTKNKIADWNRSFKTMSNPLDLNVPLVVLINERSASASEIVAGALQDFDRAVLLGRKSFGKGLVQNTKDIAYNGTIKLTTAKYYIPSKRCIQALEYKDGTPIEIPDSLKTAFKTQNGRTVYDGGGLMPDVKIDKEPLSAITQALIKYHAIEDFASKYRENNEKIAEAKSFHLSDKDFEDFKKFLEETKFQYNYQSQDALTTLSNKSSNAEIKQLAKTVNTRIDDAKNQELIKNKAEIMRILEIEIVARYYYERGKVEIQLREDKDVKEAIKLLNDKTAYQNILKP